MNTKPIITKSEFTLAAQAIQTLSPAIAALQKINKTHFDKNTDDFAQVRAALSIIQNRLTYCEQVHSAVKVQYQANGGLELVSKVALASGDLYQQIAGQPWAIRTIQLSHKNKIKELEKLELSPDQIKEIAPFPQDLIDSENQKTEAMIAERGKLLEFLKSQPALNIDLLTGTRFEKAVTDPELAAA